MSRGNHYAAMANPAKNAQFRRRWSEDPSHGGGLRPAGEIATALTAEIARRAVRHWLQKADQYEGEDRAACLATADHIVRVAGLRWSDFAPRRAA